MRRSIAILLTSSAVVLAACNDGQVVQGVTETPTPTPTVEPTPTPQPTATPEPCQFYGIDASSNLWIIDPVAVTANVVGPTGVSAITDIAITPDNRILAIGFDRAWSLDPSTGNATQISGSAWLDQQNALDALPDGRLLIGGDDALAVVDPVTGYVTPAGTMGGGRVFSGDIAVAGSTFALATGKDYVGGDDHLYSFDIANDSSVDVGSLGAPKVFGLDYGCDGNLYGMIATTPPRLVRVNPSTAQTTDLGSMAGGPSTLWGAAGPVEP